MFESLSTTASIFVAILGFGFIIFVHELGHFLAAKLFKVHVKAFSLGFPPNILHKQVGETDYRLGMIPLGGYVSMVGEDPTEKSDDPRALSNQKPWKRAIVFLAGVGMNVLSAIVIYMVASFIGVQVMPAVVGDTVAGRPAQRAGLEVNDRIVAIDGEKIESFRDISALVLVKGLDSPDHEFNVEVLRDGQPLQFKMRSELGDFPGASMQVPQLGIQPPALPVVSHLVEGSPAAQAGLKEGDRILRVNSQETPFWGQADEALAFPGDEPLTIVVSRPQGDQADEAEVALTVDPTKISVPYYGMLPPLHINQVTKGSPAEAAGIKKGDRVIDAEGMQRPVSLWLSDFISRRGNQPVNFTLLRDGKQVEVTVTPQFNEQQNRALIGVVFGNIVPDDSSPRIIHAAEGGPLDRAGIPSGAEVISINDKSTGSWRRYMEAVAELDGDPVTVTWRTPGEEQEHRTEVIPDKVPSVSLLQGARSQVALRERLDPIYNPIEAFGKSLGRIKRLAFMQYITVKGLFTGQVPTEELGGPIRIGTSFYQVARTGQVTEFMMFLALVSVAIAMLNIMPVPPLDGGHIMFLAIEKVSGRAVPERLRSAVTMVGTILLLSLVVFVFYNDIRNVLTNYVL